MELYDVLSLIGGLAFFLFGMHIMSGSLGKMAGGKLERLLKKVTANPFLSLLLGAAITVAMQSSSATTVMLVGLVNSGIMAVSQTVSVILGANVGTTVTAWILSLSGIQSDAVWVQLLKPIYFSPPFALIGIVLVLFSKSDRKRTLGSVFVGFALLMYGMTLMSDSMSPLASMPGFSDFLGKLENPLLGLLVALLFTALVQSSAASIGVMQALSLSGGLSFGMVIPMIMGLNIGTCITALLSCIGAKTNAKRVAVIHLSVKVLGTLICLPVFFLLKGLGVLPFLGTAATPWGIALVHTVYNLLLTLLFLPLSKLLVKLATLLVREKNAGGESIPESFTLDERLLRVPSVAIAECQNKTVEMCTLAHDTLIRSFRMLFAYDETEANEILAREDRLDLMEDKLGTYLVPLAARNLSASDSRAVSRMLHTIGDFERLGDHAVNLLKTSKEMHEKKITLSPGAMTEIQTLLQATEEILNLTEEAYRKNDAILCGRVEPLEQVIDKLIASVKNNHINRLVAGDCTLEHGFILSDILTNLERVSDHCSNIAVAVIELGHNTFETHRYLNGVKYGNAAFDELFAEYDGKYQIKN